VIAVAMSGSKYPARAHAKKVVSELIKLLPSSLRNEVCDEIHSSRTLY